MTSYDRYETIRKKQGLSNADVSRGTGISDTTISAWKKGRYPCFSVCEKSPKYRVFLYFTAFVGTFRQVRKIHYGLEKSIMDHKIVNEIVNENDNKKEPGFTHRTTGTSGTGHTDDDYSAPNGRPAVTAYNAGQHKGEKERPAE